jgi:alpha-L-rhamnosidase
MMMQHENARTSSSPLFLHQTLPWPAQPLKENVHVRISLQLGLEENVAIPTPSSSGLSSSSHASQGDVLVLAQAEADFRTALLYNQSHWDNAQWIAPDSHVPRNECETLHGNVSTPQLRREFTLPVRNDNVGIARASLYVCGLGWGVTEINGRRVGSRELDPALSLYNRTVFYSAYDVLDLLAAPGQANALGVTLGRGWWNPVQIHLFGHFDLYREMAVGPERLLLQLDVIYADNSTWQLTSEADSQAWQCRRGGPILGNSVYFGEVYDVGKRDAGWSMPGGAGPGGGWAPCSKADDSAMSVEGKPMGEQDRSHQAEEAA